MWLLFWLELLKMVSLWIISSFLIYTIFLDITKVCSSTGLIAKCAQDKFVDCIGQQVYRHTNFFQRNLPFFLFRSVRELFRKLLTCRIIAVLIEIIQNVHSEVYFTFIINFINTFIFISYRWAFTDTRLFCCWFIGHFSWWYSKIDCTTTSRWFTSRL